MIQSQDSAPSEHNQFDELLDLSGLSGLDTPPDIEDVRTALILLGELAQELGALDRSLLRTAAVAALKAVNFEGPATAVVDAALAVKTSPDAEQGTSIKFDEPEQWYEPVDGQQLIEAIIETFRRYIVLPKGGEVAAALWVIHTYAFGAAVISPILALYSPAKRCGKTRMMQVLACVVFRPLPASNITPPAIFRTVSMYCPALLLDEADTFLDGNSEMRGILNSGHDKASAHVIRLEKVKSDQGESYEPESHTTWGPKAIAMIGKLPGTLADRAIQLGMKRMTRTANVERLKPARLKEKLRDLRRKVVRWSNDNIAQLTDAEPVLPPALNDRQADNWEPLFAIADAIGGEWSKRARNTALLLSGQVEDDDTGVKLLADIRPYIVPRFRAKSSDLIVYLTETLEGSRWSEWRRGSPLTLVGLAGLLGPFGIKPKSIRFAARTEKGYTAQSFEESFDRYLPSLPNPQDISEQDADSDSQERKRIAAELIRWQMEQLPDDDADGEGLEESWLDQGGQP